jgi:alanine dehydrogenase
MLVSIPLKYAVSQVVGYIKGKSAIHIASILQELILVTGTILLAGNFGPEVISHQQLVEMRKPSVSTSKDRKTQTKESTI